jgi:hypothetical protein
MSYYVVTIKPTTKYRLRVSVYKHPENEAPFRIFSGRSNADTLSNRSSAAVAEILLKMLTTYRDAKYIKFIGATDQLNSDIRDVLDNTPHAYITPFEMADRVHIAALKSHYEIRLDNDEKYN